MEWDCLQGNKALYKYYLQNYIIWNEIREISFVEFWKLTFYKLNNKNVALKIIINNWYLDKKNVVNLIRCGCDNY